MSRIRTVKPELFRHEELFDAELESGLPLRLSFIGLFTVADCEGRFRWKPRTLKLDVLPHDVVDFAAVLTAMEQHGFIQSYEVGGVKYGHIPTFTKHQRFSGSEANAISELPAPPASSGKHSGSTQENSGSTQEVTGKHPGTLEREKEGKGREEEREEEGNGEVLPELATATTPASVEPTPAKPLAVSMSAVTHQKATKPKAPALPECPDDLDSTAWQRFVEYRISSKKPMTPEAAKITQARLLKAQGFGWSPETLIDDAIANNWQGCVYSDKHFQPPPTPKAAAIPGGHRHPQPKAPTLYRHPDADRFDAILQNLSRPILEGEVCP